MSPYIFFLVVETTNVSSVRKKGTMWKFVEIVKEKKKKTSNSGDAIVAEENSNTANVLSIIVTNSGDEWTLDSRCSYKMSPNRDWFTTYQPINGGKVLMGNNIVCKVFGIGSIWIKMHHDIIRTLTDVRHVLELKKNLISLGTLDSKGCTYKARGGVLRISKGVVVVMKWKKINGLYTLHGNTVTGVATI